MLEYFPDRRHPVSKSFTVIYQRVYKNKKTGLVVPKNSGLGRHAVVNKFK